MTWHVNNRVWLALKSRIDTLVTDPVMPIIPPLATFTRPSDAIGPAPFILIDDHRNDNVPFGMGAQVHNRSGVLRLTVHWPIARDIEYERLAQIAGAIAAHFKSRTRMDYDDIHLVTEKDNDDVTYDRTSIEILARVNVPWLSNTIAVLS